VLIVENSVRRKKATDRELARVPAIVIFGVPPQRSGRTSARLDCFTSRSIPPGGVRVMTRSICARSTHSDPRTPHMKTTKAGWSRPSLVLTVRCHARSGAKKRGSQSIGSRGRQSSSSPTHQVPVADFAL